MELEEKIRREKEAERVLAEILSFVNNYGMPKKEFAEALMRQHRTLQQSVFDLFLTCINEWAKQEHYDLRNEHTILTSRKIVEALDGNTYVPLI